MLRDSEAAASTEPERGAILPWWLLNRKSPVLIEHSPTQPVSPDCITAEIHGTWSSSLKLLAAFSWDSFHILDETSWTDGKMRLVNPMSSYEPPAKTSVTVGKIKVPTGSIKSSASTIRGGRGTGGEREKPEWGGQGLTWIGRGLRPSSCEKET